MKRLHVHVGVEDIRASIRFYSTLFAAEPTVTKSDYAKWMLEGPRVNFAISHRRGDAGIRHLGFRSKTPVGPHPRKPKGRAPAVLRRAASRRRLRR